MYIITMAVVLRKKPVTIYLQELKYLMFQKMAKEQNRKAAELVRDAMDEYIQNHSAPKKKNLIPGSRFLLVGLKTGRKTGFQKIIKMRCWGVPFDWH